MSQPAAGGPSEPDDVIRVYLVDDHAVVRRGMRAFLETAEDMDVVGEARDGRAALEDIDRLAAEGRLPHVVMMDLVMPGGHGMTATSLIKDRHPSIEVVAVTSFLAQDKIQEALAAGATGYVLKDAEAEEVASAVRAAHRGEIHVSAAAVRELTKALRPPAHGRDAGVLTKREREVLALVAEGASNKELARTLSISERTARTHVSNILTKLDLRSRTQAALWAIREGLASPGG